MLNDKEKNEQAERAFQEAAKKEFERCYGKGYHPTLAIVTTPCPECEDGRVYRVEAKTYICDKCSYSWVDPGLTFGEQSEFENE